MPSSYFFCANAERDALSKAAARIARNDLERWRKAAFPSSPGRAMHDPLAVAAFIVVPFGAFRSLLAERDQHTWEVLSITTLKPRQIVWGKLLSAMVQIFIYYSAITPFMAFAILLKGIDVPTIAVVLAASLFWSLALSMIALTVSTFGSQRYWQVFLTLAVLGGLVLGWLMPVMLVVNAAVEFEIDSAGFWWGTAIIASLLGAYCVLCLQIAIGQLTFDADNRTTTVRLAASAVFLLALGWIFVGTSLAGAWGIPALAPTDLGEFLREDRVRLVVDVG